MVAVVIDHNGLVRRIAMAETVPDFKEVFDDMEVGHTLAAYRVGQVPNFVKKLPGGNVEPSTPHPTSPKIWVN